ncbi:HNH endonuclease family protein [Streptacidiphilus sp. N1-12]|uniref:HNH endonuclease family protein n=2 Tax=Streptacidiphilus alkalitolerans TaxID=3342712 RepID=A0ABV6W7P4_9ACTN
MRRLQVVAVSAAVVMAGLAGCHPVNGTSSDGAGDAATTRATSTAGATSGGSGDGGGSAAAKALAGLTVHPKGSMTGYDRLKFGAAWTDNNNDPGGHNHCDTRDDILARDLTGVSYKSGHCTVATGTLQDPYTGKTIHFVRGPDSTKVQIDHVVPLGDAWVTGAAQLSATQRLDLAEDPLELIAADGPANEAKGDGDASEWLPANTAYQCKYVARQIAVKAKYKLWVTAAERSAMQKVLTTCPDQTLPTE